VSVLLEHCGGNFPLWLTPNQVIILPISEKYHEYAQNILNLLNNYDIRALVDERAEKAGRKIRDAEISKIPFMLIVGEKEENESTVSVRRHGGEDLGSIKTLDFIDMIQKEINALVSNFE
jgi:threonyl-tRNA synthetase